jgi:hypothetical protein
MRASRHEYLLNAIRCASLRAKLLEIEINSVGVALKGNAISDEVAIEWLKDIGAISLCTYMPDAIVTAAGGPE